MDKFRQERNLLLELNRTKQTAQEIQLLYKYYILHQSKKAVETVHAKLSEAQKKIEDLNANIGSNKAKIVELDKEIEESCDKETVWLVLVNFPFIFGFVIFRKVLSNN